ncbi:MAG: hypothetical protein RR263_03120, partial [Oscillospiraceae bacterium]
PKQRSVVTPAFIFSSKAFNDIKVNSHSLLQAKSSKCSGIFASIFSLALAGLFLLLTIFIIMQCVKGLKSSLKITTTKGTEEKYIGVEVSDNV